MKENGAVSIYVVIVTFLIFLFNAVLIDFVRIMVAEYQTEQATKTAVRSTFSSYNKDVQNKGLFVISEGESSGKIFETVFEKNLAPEEEGYFKFVDTKMESTSFKSNEERSFANEEIVKHQILEDMKYKAPIEFGKVILDGVLPYACTMLEAEITVDVAEAVDKDIKDRDAEMKNAIEHLKAAKQKLKNVDGEINDPSRSSYPDVKNLQDAVKHNEEYHDDENPPNEYKTDLKNVLNEIESQSDLAYKELKKAKKELKDAQKENKKIEETITEIREEVEAKYDNLSSGNCDQTKTSEAEEEMNKLKDPKEYQVEPQFFQDALAKTEKAMKSIDNGKGTTTQSLIPYVEYQIDDLDGMIEKSQIKPSVNLLKGYYDTAYKDTKNAVSFADDNYEEQEAVEDSEDGGLGKALEALGKIKDFIFMAEGLNEDSEKYETLKKLVTDYGNVLSDDAGNLDMDDPKQGAKDAFDIVSGLFNQLGNLGKNIRDKAYISEYILTRFNADDSLGLFDPNSYPENFLFYNREVEYILYGQHASGANYMAALLELTATRFAFNFIAAFTKDVVKVAPHPIAKFIAATGWAFSHTVDDIRNLTSGTRKVPLLDIPGVKFDTDYKFYLRLFLLIHSSESDERINRIQAVVDDKTPENIQKAPTYASVKTESSIDLWFIPGITKMLGTTGILDGYVKDGRYFINEKIDYSY